MFVNSIQYCAYHASQKLTNFCRCQQCLLPVCPTCIKLHSQEHYIKQINTPQYQKIQQIYQQVYDSCTNILKGLSKLRNQLLQVEKVKKQNQSLILQKIKMYRNKIIRQFQRALTDLQYAFIKKFQSYDSQFISQLQSLDKTIEDIQKQVNWQKRSLQTNQSLTSVILFLNKNLQIAYLRQISQISQMLKKMLQKNIYLSVEENSIDEVKTCVQNFLTLGQIDWSINNSTDQNTNHTKQLSRYSNE